MQNQEKENQMVHSRVLKFRAWDKERNSMRTSRMMMIAFDGQIHPNGQDSFWPSNFIIMQYTGLKDKNGKEIYEGDIVEIKGEGHCVIEWKHDYSMIGWSPYIAKHGTAWEIIGNIYQNPELLK